MTAGSLDSLAVRRFLTCEDRRYTMFSLAAAEENGAGPVSRLPRCLKVLLENLLRREDGLVVTCDHIIGFADGLGERRSDREIPFFPSRVLLNDTGGLPALADFAALRAAMARQGGDPKAVNPCISADLIIDHSAMVDAYASPTALDRNIALEYERNGERYQFLRWCQQALANLRVVPPSRGIAHQVNLEFLARTVWVDEGDDGLIASPESLVGTDSHTPMINALGVLGWGVGGIEAVAALLGQPLSLRIPRVVGCRLTGTLPGGVTTTDLVLTLTERLRSVGVVGSFVEFFGPGLTQLRLFDRATLANMAPEYGATVGFFPVDAETLHYLALTGRDPHQVRLVEAYTKAQGLWHDPGDPASDYSEVITLDLSAIEPSLAGPKRPQDRVALGHVPESFEPMAAQTPPLPAGGTEVAGRDWRLDHGSVVIAAITSCTNAAHPAAILGAGLLARNAVRRGLTVRPWVKTSLAPGSRVVADYLASTGLQADLDRLGFHIVGFGCTTCIGNSGSLAPEIAAAIETGPVTAVAVLSGNRNFEGRINPLAKASYLASPALVVAYALAGTVRRDLTSESLGFDRDGQPVYLREIWPDPGELSALLDEALTVERFTRRYGDIFAGDERWNALDVPEGDLFVWDPASLYLKDPPYFDGFSREPGAASDIRGARILVMLGDSITTDHISPAGSIPAASPAGQYLIDRGVPPAGFNFYAARRTNHELMIRGTFANIRLRTEMVPDREGGWTRHQPSGDVLPIHAAAERYRGDAVPMVVIAGKEYGCGSSRDWAAKGPALLGVRAVIAESHERIHRSNLIGMGVLPLQFSAGVTRRTLGLDGSETISILGLEGGIMPRMTVTCLISRADGSTVEIPLQCRLDTEIEARYFRHGGILPYMLRTMLEPERAALHA